MESPQKAFIEKIRLEKFSIGAEIPNPLAATLHEAIRHLSAELYQKDIHFISELIQNAEDNSYGVGVQPELEIVLTRTDVTGVGAPATLLIFNNELGFQERNISALCSVGQSTKKGQRNEGYIGEKGIGFKSVFLVTSTPYVISNGFRIRFSESGEEATGLGYIVPKWVERPTDDELRCFCRPAAGASSERSLLGTTIVLPLRPEKVASVAAELKQISPETILFLRRITRLRVREEFGEKVYQEVIVSRSDSQRVSHEDDATGFVTNLSVAKGPGLITEARDYFVWEQRFDVCAPVEQRKEVKTWVITLAFPHQDRVAGGSPGSVYAFLPSQLSSGFPFLINADFLLVSSRETLKFDSPWNQGILSCVPTAFCTAILTLLRRSDAEGKSSSRISAPHVYKYVPVNECHVHLGSVKQTILRALGKQESILAATDVGCGNQTLCTPSMSRRVDERFRRLLERCTEQNVLTSASNSNDFVVDGSVQGNYPEVLDQLSVPWMASSRYLQILSDSNWLLSLSDELYLEVLAFISVVLPSIGLPSRPRYHGHDIRSHINSLQLVKYDDSSTIKLISVEKLKELRMALYISPPQQGSHLSKWVERLGPWIAYRFMPQQTVISMDEARVNHGGVRWLRTTASVRDIDVETFASELVQRCTREQHQNTQAPTIDANFLLLVWKFVYTSVQEGELKSSHWAKHDRDLAVVDESRQVKWINRSKMNASSTGPLVLLPRSCSKWPLLLTDEAWSNNAIIRLSEDYLNLRDNSQCAEYERESCKVFLQDTFGASDLPDLPAPDVPFPQLTSLSSEQSRLLLQWLNRLRERTTEASIIYSKFWSSLKTIPWLHTQEHGLQCPGMCFIPNDDLKGFFLPSEVPFVDESFYGDVKPYSEILHKLGAVHCCKAGCEAVAQYIGVLRNRAGTTVTKKIMTKYYNYLRVHKWKPSIIDRASMEIFIPAETGRQPSWQSAQVCVIEDPENLFRGMPLPILRDIYPEGLLIFFENELGVPRTATAARYLDVWIYWRENRIQYDSENSKCAQLWEKIAVNWKYFQPHVKQQFKNKAAVLTQTTSGELQITSPDSVFIPDNLQLRRIFMKDSSKLLCVWYPKGSSKIEAEFNAMYAELGVKRLSDCVKMITNINDKKLSSCSTNPTPKFITPGLLVAILGFISNSEHDFSSQRRQSIILQLCGSAEKEISNPCCIVYKMSSSASVVTAVEDHLLGFCDSKGVIHRLAETHELLTDSTKVREMETQVLESICSKILPDSPTIARSLVDFLKMLVGSRFDEAAVEYELRRKNLQLYSEDLEFLEKATKPLVMADVNLRAFKSLQIR